MVKKEYFVFMRVNA